MFVFTRAFNLISMESIDSLEKEHYFLLEIISLYLIPDLAQMAIDYLSIREVLLREWTVGDNKVKESPFGIAIHDQRVYVADYQKPHIRVYDKDGKPLHLWDLSQENIDVNSSDYIAISKQGEIFVVDRVGKCVNVFSLEGKFLWRLSHGQGPLTFPDVLTIHNEELYVADLTRNEVLIYSLRGEYLRGWEIPQEYKASDEAFFFGIAVSPDGKETYVIYDERIFIHDHEGTRPSEWKNSEHKMFMTPTSIAISLQGEIYIPDGNNCLNVFNKDGQFIREWGSKGIGKDDKGQIRYMYPDVIALSPQKMGNEIYVTNMRKQKVYVFRQTYF
jgi:DNA-binding beta-propeller fold protein YncE